MGARAAEVTGIIDSRAEELEQIPPRAIEEARRERRYEIANNLYLDVRQRYETASLAAASSIPDVRILDEAVVPRLAAVDQRFQFGAMFFFGALGAGFLLDHAPGPLRSQAPGPGGHRARNRARSGSAPFPGTVAARRGETTPRRSAKPSETCG